jgi:hypothetical protein
MEKCMRLLGMGLIALAIIPVASNAQSARLGAASISPPLGAAETHSSAVRGPTLESAAIGFRLASSPSADIDYSKAKRRSAHRDDLALVVVGVAAMAAGSVIGGTSGTVFLVGGAIIALVGLYNLVE